MDLVTFTEEILDGKIYVFSPQSWERWIPSLNIFYSKLVLIMNFTQENLSYNTHFVIPGTLLKPTVFLTCAILASSMM